MTKTKKEDSKNKNKYHFVTSFSTRLWEKFAKNTIGTFVSAFKDGFPDGVESFTIFLDTEQEIQPFIQAMELPEEISEKFRFGSLDTVAEYVGFERMFGGDIPFKDRGINIEKIPDGMQFRYNYLPFAKKVFSWAATYMSIQENEFLVWIDADIILKNKFGSEFLDPIADQFDITFLDRDFPWYAAETGFFILRRCPVIEQFVQLVLHTYVTGFLFDLSEWHDGYVFKVLMKLGLQNSDARVLNLNRTMRERDVFERTLLADVMEHYKGNKKSLFKDQSDDIYGPSESPTLINFDPDDQ